MWEANIRVRQHEDGRAIVELTIARESIGAAKQISRQMSGAFK